MAALRTVLVDKDYKEINAWQKICSGVRVLLCQVHAARTVRKKCLGRSDEVFHSAIKEIRRL